MQRESESEESVLWNEIGEVLDTEMSTVEDIRADLAIPVRQSITVCWYFSVIRC